MKSIVLMLIAFATWSGNDVPQPVPGADGPPKERLVVDADRSIIHWKGTKFWGMGQHEGVVRLAEGSLIVREGTIIAGRFVIDMTTIEVTDIPKSDPIPRRRLREHLKDEHFFFVERFPTAVFEITAAHRDGEGGHRIDGRLTMRGTTHGVSFDALVPVLDATTLRATARFSINRHDWGVAYRGSRLTNDLVDDLIELNLILVADKPDES